jgi:hypothetical protein
MHLMGWSTSRDIPNANASTWGKFGVTGSKLTYRHQSLSATLSLVRDKSRHEHTECEVLLVLHPLRITIQAMTLLEPDSFQ